MTSSQLFALIPADLLPLYHAMNDDGLQGLTTMGGHASSLAGGNMERQRACYGLDRGDCLTEISPCHQAEISRKRTAARLARAAIWTPERRERQAAKAKAAWDTYRADVLAEPKRMGRPCVPVSEQRERNRQRMAERNRKVREARQHAA